MNTTTESIETLSPSAIDEKLAEIWDRQQRQIASNASTRRTLDRYTKASRYTDDLAERLRDGILALGALYDEARPYEAEFSARGGWSRFFVVKNVGGHVHSSMECSTCFPTTDFGWYPKLSGSTEEEMVAEFGEMACTVCFPSAPAFRGFGDGTSAIARYTADEKAARDAEKAAKRAAKDAKAITAPDGSELQVGPYRDTVGTIVSAERKLSEFVQDFVGYGIGDAERGRPHPSAAEWQQGALDLIDALLARGIDADRIDGIVARAEKKARKEWTR